MVRPRRHSPGRRRGQRGVDPGGRASRRARRRQHRGGASAVRGDSCGLARGRGQQRGAQGAGGGARAAQGRRRARDRRGRGVECEARARALEGHQRLGERGGGGEAAGGLALQAASDDLGEAGGRLGDVVLDRGRVVATQRREAVRDVVAGEQLHAGDRLVEDHADRPQVGAGVDGRGPLDLLGRHVVRRSHRHAGLRLRGVGELRDPEVHQLDQPLPADRPAQEDVLGLQVAMDDAGAVRRVEARERLADDPHREPGVEAAMGLDQVGQRAALEQLHDDVRPDLTLAEVEDIADIRAPDPPGRGGLVAKARQQLGVPGVARVHQLDRHRAMNQRVGRLPHARHPPVADPPVEPELAAEQAPLQRQHDAVVGALQPLLREYAATTATRPQGRRDSVRLRGSGHRGAVYTSRPGDLHPDADLPRMLENEPAARFGRLRTRARSSDRTRGSRG